MVATIRHVAGTRMGSVPGGTSTPGGTMRDRVGGAPTLERQHHGLAGQHGEQLAEGAVEVGPVQLVDHEPLAALDGVDEHARPEDEALEGGLEAADGLERRPLGGGRGRQVAGAHHRPLRDLGRQVGERGLARAGRAGQHHVLAGVDGRHDLLHHVGVQAHAGGFDFFLQRLDVEIGHKG